MEDEEFRQPTHTDAPLDDVENDSHFGSNCRADNLKFVSFNLENVLIVVDFSFSSIRSAARKLRMMLKHKIRITNDASSATAVAIDLSEFQLPNDSARNELKRKQRKKEKTRKREIQFRISQNIQWRRMERNKESDKSRARKSTTKVKYPHIRDE